MELKNKKKKDIPFIILDLFGVLTLGSYKNTCLWISKKYHLNYNYVYQIVYYKYFSLAALGKNSKISEAKSFSLAVKELNICETGPQLRMMHMSFQKLNRPVLRLAQSWQKRGARIVIFSKNTPQQFNEIVRMFSLRKYFPAIVNSYNLGLEKKSSKALRYLLKRFKSVPRHTLMIDDQAYTFVNADKIGIKTLLYKNPVQLKREVNMWLKKF